MSNIKYLFGVYNKNFEMPLPKKGFKATAYTALAIIAVTCIVIPCCLIVGFITDILSEAMMMAGSKTAALMSEIHIMSVFSLVFGLFVIFSVLFFSSDREHMVTLPITPTELLAAKFRHTYIAESIMEFLVLLSMFIGYFIACVKNYGSFSSFGPVSVLMALIATFVTPLLPLVYCAIISMLLMALLKNVRNAKLFFHVSDFFLLLFIALFLLSFKDSGGVTVTNYIDSLLADNNLFFRICNILFFTVPILGKAMEAESIIYSLLYLAANIIPVALMLLIGKYLYLEGLHTAASLGSTHKQANVDKLNIKLTSPLSACFKKEFRVLLRTKAYSNNCVYINLLWPVGVILFFVLSRKNENVIRFIELYKDPSYPRAALITMLAVIAISFIASALNTLASTAFSREGAHVDLIKYIPVPYSTQLYAKVLTALVFTYPALLLSIIAAQHFLGFGILTGLVYALTAFLAMTICIVTGLSMDSAAPFTVWSDEYSALRGNLNSFFNMAVSMLVAFLLCALIFLLYELTTASLATVTILVLVILGIAATFAVSFGRRIIINNMKELY
ncbi:MAG: hypothetical protein K5686_06570 [Lachnospiraceae bacterium]|nr:hypothetical protein [Lachnospiraceae bacterium]